MPELRDLAGFVGRARYEQIAPRAVQQLKMRILDALGVAIGASATSSAEHGHDRGELELYADDQGAPAYDDAASPVATRLQHLLLRPHLDFGDVYLARSGICHPSAHIGQVLVAADGAAASGRDLIAAVAVAYAVETRLADAVTGPVTEHGPRASDGWAVAAAVAKLRGLDTAGIVAAIARSGAGGDQRGVQRTARRGPELVAGAGSGPAADRDGDTVEVTTPPGPVDWSKEGLDSVLETMMRVNFAGIWGQSAIDAALTIAAPPVFRPGRGVRAVQVKTFQAAFDTIGGGDGMDRQHVVTAVHAAGSLPYMVAVALLDHEVQPRQYALERVLRSDVQTLLRKVSVAAHAPFTASFPAALRAQVEVEMVDATRYCASTLSYRGSTLRPLDWPQVQQKFYSLVAPYVGDATAHQIASCVYDLESHAVRQVTALLAKVSLRPWRDGSAYPG